MFLLTAAIEWPEAACCMLQVMNTLDQFNINMCNEVLQGEFVRCIFDLEQVCVFSLLVVYSPVSHAARFYVCWLQALYKDQIQEEIEIDFDKNYDTIELMKGRRNSIIAAMDTVITKNKVGKAADKEFYSGLDRMSKDKSNAAAVKRLNMKDGRGRKTFAEGGPYGYDPAQKGVPREQRDETPGFFRLEHYAANVTYDVRDWIDKNMDKLSSNCYLALKSSTLPHFMAPVFTSKEENAAKSTVARDFARSLDELVTTLQMTDFNFVRCLKASNPLAANVFKNALVLNQLKYTGMLDTLIIRRGGFPIRMTYQDFVDQYRLLDPNCVVAADAPTLVASVQGMLPGLIAKLDEKPPASQQSDAIRCGTPKKPELTPLILMRDWLARELDAAANEKKALSAVICQAVVRMGLALNPYMNFRNATKPLVNEVVSFVARGIVARGEEAESSAENLKVTIAFNDGAAALKQAAADERQLMTAEEAYSTSIKDAMFGEQIAGLKAKEVGLAEDFYKKALNESVKIPISCPYF